MLFRSNLTKAGIGTGIHYPVPLHLQEAYRHLQYPTGRFFQFASGVASEILRPLAYVSSARRRPNPARGSRGSGIPFLPAGSQRRTASAGSSLTRHIPPGHMPDPTPSRQNPMKICMLAYSFYERDARI